MTLTRWHYTADLRLNCLTVCSAPARDAEGCEGRKPLGTLDFNCKRSKNQFEVNSISFICVFEVEIAFCLKRNPCEIRAIIVSESCHRTTSVELLGLTLILGLT